MSEDNMTGWMKVLRPNAAEDGNQAADGGCPPAACSLLTVIERPLLLTSGQLRQRLDTGVPVILIDSEQPHAEKLVTLWHEVVHLLRAAGNYSQDEASVEDAAKRLAAACPEALAWVGIHEANDEMTSPH